MRDQVSAEAHVDTFAEDPERVGGATLALGAGTPTGGELVPYQLPVVELPSFDLSRLALVPSRPTGLGRHIRLGRNRASGDILELPAFDLTQLQLAHPQPAPADAVPAAPEPAESRPLPPAQALAASVDLSEVDLTHDEVIIDLTGSVPALELAARLSLPVSWPDDDGLGRYRPLDPVVQVLIDRVRVKQVVAQGGRLPRRCTGQPRPPKA